MTKPLILIAEDDPDDQYFFQEAIEVAVSSRVDTYFVLDGAKLIKTMQEMKLDISQKMIIILDLNMPVKNGQSTLQDLKENPAFTHIPVIILTTSSHEKDRQYCMLHGASAYYRKPESITELVKIVRTLYTEYLH